jgi:molybdopterin converting factor small subunit
MFDKEIPDGYIEVTIERGGESVNTIVPEGSTLSALIQDGHLRGVDVATTRVNGAPADTKTPLRAGDSVAQVPKSGTQG